MDAGDEKQAIVNLKQFGSTVCVNKILFRARTCRDSMISAACNISTRVDTFALGMEERSHKPKNESLQYLTEGT